MKKHRISTTISLKHRDILMGHIEKYGSQQKVLEAALEQLDKGDGFRRISKIQQQRMELLSFPGAVIINRRSIKHTIEGRWDKIAGEGLYEFGILVTSGKLTDGFTFSELIASLCHLFRLLNLFEEIVFEEADDTCTVKLLHHEGKTYSKYFACLNEEFFKRHEIDYKTEISEYFILHTLSSSRREDSQCDSQHHEQALGNKNIKL